MISTGEELGEPPKQILGSRRDLGHLHSVCHHGSHILRCILDFWIRSSFTVPRHSQSPGSTIPPQALPSSSPGAVGRAGALPRQGQPPGAARLYGDHPEPPCPAPNHTTHSQPTPAAQSPSQNPTATSPRPAGTPHPPASLTSSKDSSCREPGHPRLPLLGQLPPGPDLEQGRVLLINTSAN